MARAGSRIGSTCGQRGGCQTGTAERRLSVWRKSPSSLPLKGRDLLPGASRGPALGELLQELEEWWIAQDFAPDRDVLLQEARRRLRKT